ncbi:Rpn family recombination-promoting nuclease/putative transposase [Coleofasciculus sp. H7-2]|uniref:Rpn family recombination-promoting nuclease/putative transposase n=1 Tax=Coleofasciculus sp. H7-2 TaxID=3351545 RepID=UPI003673628C
MATDNICKYLAEQYPAEFVLWLLEAEPTDIQVLKTELSTEPIRADSLTLLQTGNRILHIEFQTLPASDPPLPFRMLDYWVRLYRQYRCPIEQVAIFLKSTTSEAVFTNQFTDTNTQHRYRVIRMWEQDPAFFLGNIALLPLAALARSDSPQTLLEQVVAQLDMIEEPEQRGNVAACIEVLAGLRFDENLIRQLLREEIMQESVTYQAIIRKGVQQGKQEGKKEEALSLIMRQLARRLGAVDQQMQERIQALPIAQLEELGEALLDFTAPTDLAVWFEEHQS